MWNSPRTATWRMRMRCSMLLEAATLGASLPPPGLRWEANAVSISLMMAGEEGETR